MFHDKNNKVLYVGKAKDLKKRVSSYFQDSRPKDPKTLKLLSEVTSLDHIVVNSEIEAFLLEANLIKKYHPLYNIQFSDDKFYPYIQIGKYPYPYVVITRKKSDKKSDYFGPYTSTESVKIVLKILRKVFAYHSVKNHPKRKCLYHYLGMCPCIPLFPEKIEEYKKNIRKVKDFLNGNTNKVVKSIKVEQKDAIKKQKFERAAELQKKIEKIHFVTSPHYDPFVYQEKPNFYFERIKKEVESLKEILAEYGVELSRLDRVECYDVSNIQGRQATGSMVVFVKGEASKKDYRKFKIHVKNTPDDFAMHQEMMSRRLKHLENWGVPDLMVIDGGKGQVSSVLQVLVEHNKTIPVIGLAKREETIVIPVRTLGKLEFLEVKFSRSTPGINLLRRIRDEAHRFAIMYHKLLRKKAFIPSS